VQHRSSAATRFGIYVAAKIASSIIILYRFRTETLRYSERGAATGGAAAAAAAAAAARGTRRYLLPHTKPLRARCLAITTTTTTARVPRSQRPEVCTIPIPIPIPSVRLFIVRGTQG